MPTLNCGPHTGCARQITTSGARKPSPRPRRHERTSLRGRSPTARWPLMAESLGFDIVHVGDLPKTARSVTDRENGRIYLPPASIPGRARVAIDAPPSDGLTCFSNTAFHRPTRVPPAAPGDQHIRRGLFDAAQQSGGNSCRQRRKSAISPSKTSATHLVSPTRRPVCALPPRHRVSRYPLALLARGDDGAVYKAYENDGLRLPTDVTGQPRDRLSVDTGRPGQAFARTNRTTEYYQYTDTLGGHLLGVHPNRYRNRRRVFDHRWSGL